MEVKNLLPPLKMPLNTGFSSDLVEVEVKSIKILMHHYIPRLNVCFFAIAIISLLVFYFWCYTFWTMQRYVFLLIDTNNLGEIDLRWYRFRPFLSLEPSPQPDWRGMALFLSNTYLKRLWAIW